MKTTYFFLRSILGLVLVSVLASTASAQTTTLYSVQALSGNPAVNAQGATPEYLVDGGDGYIYGVMIQGGTNGGGTLFKMKADGSTFSLLHTFGAALDGSNPRHIVVRGTTVYGITYFGGTSNSNPIAAGGTVYKINTDGSNYQVIQNLSGSSGVAYHPASLALSPDGSALVMLMSSNSSFGNSCICSLPSSASTSTTPTIAYTFLHTDQNGSFGPAGSFGNLIFSPDGLSVYGVGVIDGANNAGVVFKITLSTGVFTSLHDFSANNAQNTDGATPQGPLAISADGNTLYGVAYIGGASGGGTLFSLGVSGSAFSVLYSFPTAAVAVIAQGTEPNSVTLIGSTLYGSTYGGGSLGDGTLWEAPLSGISGSAVGEPKLHAESLASTLFKIFDLAYGFIQAQWVWYVQTLAVVGGSNVAGGNGAIQQLTVSLANAPPTPLGVTGPKDETDTIGTTASFGVVASGGTAPISYQWYGTTADGVTATAISGATGFEFGPGRHRRRD